LGGRGDAIAMAHGMSEEAVGSHAGSQDTTSLLYLSPGLLRIDQFRLGRAVSDRRPPAAPHTPA
jgi:hypothetical protein